MIDQFLLTFFHPFLRYIFISLDQDDTYSLTFLIILNKELYVLGVYYFIKKPAANKICFLDLEFQMSLLFVVEVVTRHYCSFFHRKLICTI